MLNGRGIIFSVPRGYTLAKLRRDKKQAHSLGRYFDRIHSLSEKMRLYNDLIYKHFAI